MKARVVYRSKKARYFRGSERRQWDAPSAAPKAPIHQPRVPDGAMPPVKARTGRENYAACGVARHRLVGHGLAGHGPALRYLLHPIGVSDGVCAETVTRAAPWPGESDPVGVDGRADGDSIETPPHPNPLPKGEGMEARPQFALRIEPRLRQHRRCKIHRVVSASVHESFGAAGKNALVSTSTLDEDGRCDDALTWTAWQKPGSGLNGGGRSVGAAGESRMSCGWRPLRPRRRTAPKPWRPTWTWISVDCGTGCKS